MYADWLVSRRFSFFRKSLGREMCTIGGILTAITERCGKHVIKHMDNDIGV